MKSDNKDALATVRYKYAGGTISVRLKQYPRTQQERQLYEIRVKAVADKWKWVAIITVNHILIALIGIREQHQ